MSWAHSSKCAFPASETISFLKPKANHIVGPTLSLLMLHMQGSDSMHAMMQVNDFMADAIVSQLLLLDAQDPTKVFAGRPSLLLLCDHSQSWWSCFWNFCDKDVLPWPGSHNSLLQIQAQKFAAPRPEFCSFVRLSFSPVHPH